MKSNINLIRPCTALVVVGLVSFNVSKMHEIHRGLTMGALATSFQETSFLPALFESRPQLSPATKYKWPQQDDSLRQAILQGKRIEANTTSEVLVKGRVHYECQMFGSNETQLCQKPTKGLATVVTAYYHLKSKHAYDTYLRWLDLMMTSTDPLVIFVEPNDSAWKQVFDWGSFILERRKHAPTLVVPMEFGKMTMNTAFSDEFWWNVTDPDTEYCGFGPYRGTAIYKMWNQKMIFMQEVAQLNPFQTEHFFWIDAGYFRNRGTSPKRIPIVRNNITANGVQKDQVLFQNVWLDPLKPEIAAGAWGGTAEAIDRVYDRYFQTFWWMIENREGCVGIEQQVMTKMCKSFPDICNIQQSEWDKSWFEMGRVWLRRPMKDLSRPVPLLVNETEVLVGNVQLPGERVSQPPPSFLTSQVSSK